MYYVEFSVVQNCFHVDKMDRIQEINLDLCRRGISEGVGYVVVAGPLEFKDALNKCEELNYLKKPADRQAGI